MTIELIRKENDRTYLYGELQIEGEYKCDTLEFGSGCQLPIGSYSIKIGVDKQRQERVMQIYNEDNELVSKFVKDNTYMYHSIRMRYENNHICLGVKVLEPLLQMDRYAAHLIGTEVSGCLSIGENVELLIKNDVKLKETCF